MKEKAQCIDDQVRLMACVVIFIIGTNCTRRNRVSGFQGSLDETVIIHGVGPDKYLIYCAKHHVPVKELREKYGPVLC